MTQQLGGGEGTSQLPGGPHRLGRADTGSRDGAAPWTLGDRRVWGHQPEGGGHVGKKNNPRTNQQELRRKPDRWGGAPSSSCPWSASSHCGHQRATAAVKQSTGQLPGRTAPPQQPCRRLRVGVSQAAHPGRGQVWASPAGSQEAPATHTSPG